MSLFSYLLAASAPADATPETTDLVVNTVLAGVNLQDTASPTNSPPADTNDINEPVDSDDGLWHTAVDPGLDIDGRYGFTTPATAPTGSQTFRARLRKTSGSTNPTVDIELWENGSLVASLLSGTAITSTVGQIVEASWSASLLSNPSGADVEIRIVGHSTAGTVALGAVAADTFSQDDWSLSHTLDKASGDNFVLIIAEVFQSGTIAAADYGGVTAQVAQEYLHTSGSTRRISIQYVLNADLPSDGSKTVNLATAGLVRGGLAVIACRVAAQAAPTHAGAVISSTSVGPTAVAVDAGAAIFQAIIKAIEEDITGGQSATEILDENDPLPSSRCYVDRLLDQSGSVGRSASWASSDGGAQAVIGVNPASGGNTVEIGAVGWSQQTAGPQQYDDVVTSFAANLVSYWKFQNSGTDQRGTEDAVIVGEPELNVETIVKNDTGGQCIAWPATQGVYAAAPHNSAHKTASGTICLTFQRDTADQNSQLFVFDDNAQEPGDTTVSVNTNGGLRVRFRRTDNVRLSLDGPANDVQTNEAYSLIFKWGAPGLSVSLWDEDGNMIRRLSDPTTDGLVGNTSEIRFGSYHNDGPDSFHDGPFGRVVWMNRRISDSEETALARPTTIDRPATPPVVEDLPFFGQYYGAGAWAAPNPGNIRMMAATPSGCSSFFIAERTGIIDRIRMHWRNYDDGSADGHYARGNGGIYTIEIRPADPVSKLPITTGLPICSAVGLEPPVRLTNTWDNITHTLTAGAQGGQVVAKQPYCLVFRNTAPSPNLNFVSCNFGVVTAFHAPADYREPVGINPASVGSSITPVSGWVPVMIDGTTRMYPWSIAAVDRKLDFDTRSGPLYAMLRYSDGQWVGGGAFASQGGGHFAISGNNMIRDRFRVTRASRTVSGVFVKVSRRSAATGNLIVSLESGPVSDTSGNGSTLLQVPVAASSLYDLGEPLEGQIEYWNATGTNAAGQPRRSADLDLVPYVWVPFGATPITLAQGSLYNLRLFKSGGSGIFDIWASQRSTEFMGEPRGAMSPSPTTLTWAQWETQRQVEWTAAEDSRGCMVSATGGTTWAFNSQTARLLPYIFKCVT